MVVHGKRRPTLVTKSADGVFGRMIFRQRAGLVPLEGGLGEGYEGEEGAAGEALAGVAVAEGQVA